MNVCVVVMTSDITTFIVRCSGFGVVTIVVVVVDREVMENNPLELIFAAEDDSDRR